MFSCWAAGHDTSNAPSETRVATVKEMGEASLLRGYRHDDRDAQAPPLAGLEVRTERVEPERPSVAQRADAALSVSMEGTRTVASPTPRAGDVEGRDSTRPGGHGRLRSEREARPDVSAEHRRDLERSPGRCARPPTGLRPGDVPRQTSSWGAGPQPTAARSEQESRKPS